MSASDKPGEAIFRCSITPRYTDLDTWRHVNNSRIYQLHQEARLLAHMDMFGKDAWFSDDIRLRPVRAITDYRLVSWYGSDIQAEVRVLMCGENDYQVRCDLYQDGNHVGTQQCVIGAFDQGRQVALPKATRDRLQQAALNTPADLAPADYIDRLNSASEFPVRQPLTPRYADLDADSQRSEAALARYMEQARFSGIRSLDMGGLGILIASADISFLRYQPGFDQVDLASGITRIGNSSFVFTGGARYQGEMQAAANSVMVVIDPASNRPVPIPGTLREQLLRLTLK
ncbi:Acyl-CoA thioesterase FadM [Halopseudomonas xinjiangensis]|uniref:Acyl-CoA thioesterase FadM n=1 Tax=Halopseudomonas xinjiangensis TaxID=487184 RepID=A0A1H1YUU4_9GAMM|nr:hotdog domain-containing protein [Halopseudomonas xinjiangensis]SDT25132.1 Acyl-CoA thioesterase FadM [Halopseudomonas xinjiangensis]